MCKMYKVVETDASPGQRSVLQLVKDLLILSRFHKYNPWLAVFSGGVSLPILIGNSHPLTSGVSVWATLLAGANQIATHPLDLGRPHRQTNASMLDLRLHLLRCRHGLE